jgi:hypothetical protein
MIVEYVDEYDVGWTTLQNIVHELWKQGHYEGYEPKLSDDWNTSIELPSWSKNKEGELNV